MKYEHPSITIEEEAPGYFSVAGIPTNHIITEAGRIVPPDRCIIHAGMPPDMLRMLADAIDERNGVKPMTATEIRQRHEERLGPQADGDPAKLEARVLEVLAEGNIQITKLAERLNCDLLELRALDVASDKFHVAAAGWVKLGPKPTAE